MKDLPLEKSLYSRHFNVLKYFGAWVVDQGNPSLMNAYAVYKTLMTVVVFTGCFFLFMDLYYAIGDFKKMSWNLCVTTLFFGSILKSIFTIGRCDVINRLRIRLHRNATSRESPEDELLNRSSAREMKIVEFMFYVPAVVVISMWLISFYFSYLWGPREIPIPVHIPVEVDLENEFTYNVIFLGLAVGGCLSLGFILETEIAMFSLLVQISREYNRLLNDLTKINGLYEDKAGKSEGSKFEVNPQLRQQRTKSLVKEYSSNQQHLIEHTKDFELGYRYCMLLQVFVLSVLLINCAMLCILEYDNLSVNLSFQIGYIGILLMDMFLVCWFSTRIRGQCLRVGEEAYEILWYNMTADIRKNICMIIMRSQRPPKITAGNMMEMNLHAFMLMLRNIYSWLALFQQLAFKSR